MRPQTPEMSFTQPTAPSSPPETPTSPTFNIGRQRRHGIQSFAHISRTLDDTLRAHRDGYHFSHNRFSRLEDLSPRSSSPSSESSGSGSPPRSLSSARSASPEPSEQGRSSPPPNYTQKANFTVEEITESDIEDMNSDDEDIIRPYHYEDAESDHHRSWKAASELDSHVVSALRHLDCDDPDSDMDDHLAQIEAMRREKRRKRRSSGSVKRTHGESVGSGTDEDDMFAPQLDAGEAGSSARRLRRKTDRSSLIFDDPPPRIEEEEEPESCEELVELHDDDTEGQGVDKNLPYYIQEMDVDSGVD
ncbi:hypothetical protein BP6252_09432 [Coleophoma cylindrospora]|uniref:Uncharacterized protein n=1 Tax=Coleophoma cylindrospora TaxID=1849047 RepID=A0A3D8R230_9HELO|nr:hypothetical protein BP6252_09432 [Coleophoma cylindrospora]